MNRISESKDREKLPESIETSFMGEFVIHDEKIMIGLNSHPKPVLNPDLSRLNFDMISCGAVNQKKHNGQIDWKTGVMYEEKLENSWVPSALGFEVVKISN